MPGSTPTQDDALALAEQASTAAAVLVGAARRPLAEGAAALLIRVVVDLHVNLPGTFALTFLDPRMNVLGTAGLALGTKVQIKGLAREGGGTKPLIEGEVTAIEGDYSPMEPLTIVRGSTMDHRLQRVRRSRTFVKAKDSAIAQQIASDAGLTVGTITTTSQVHPQLYQDNQTDWQFLRARAEEIGFEVGIFEGKFYFREAVTSGGGTPVSLAWAKSLVSFQPRVSGAGLPSEVEVRAWDPVNAKAMSARQALTSPGVRIGVGDAAAAARLFAGTSAPPATGSAELGPEPSARAQVVFDRAVTVDDNNSQALTTAAKALSAQVASGFAEAEGELLGDARVLAGSVVEIKGVPEQFCGKWTVTRARHVFDHDAGSGYRTWFAAAGNQDRTLFALTAGGANGNNRGPARIQGVVGAVVTEIADPLGLARVKVALPWLSPSYETNWAAVVQLTAGKATGAMFLPEPGDEVLVAFEFGDLRKPYVLGAVVNKRTGAGGVIQPGGNEPGKAAVKSGRPASVIRRGFVSPGGNRLVFHDDGPPGGGKPTASQVVLATKDDKVGLLLDQVGGKFNLTCKPGSPPGTLVIECDGNVEIRAGGSGSMTIDGGSSLKLKAQTIALEGSTSTTVKGASVTVESDGQTVVKGSMVSVEGTGPTAVKGKPLQLN